MNQLDQSSRLQRLLTPEEYNLLMQLRESNPSQNPPRPKLSAGERISDKVAATMGSWPFIIIQTTALALWILLNIAGWIKAWDPYPFILLNLALSFQAAYAAPFIMMSQNRQASNDRQEARHDYEVNTKAELEVEFVHDKLNNLKEQEITQIITLLQQQQQQIQQLASSIQKP